MNEKRWNNPATFVNDLSELLFGYREAGEAEIWYEVTRLKEKAKTRRIVGRAPDIRDLVDKFREDLDELLEE